MVDWSDLRFFLAVARTGTLAGAATQLSVDASTVSRRLTTLESSLGSRLFDRSPQGYRTTAAGQALLTSAERVEEQVLALERQASGADRALRGRVVLTTTEALATEIVTPHLGDFTARHPGIELVLHTGNRELNLSRREADLALRARRPTQADLVSLPAGALSFALYGAERYLLRAGSSTADGLAGHTVVTFDHDLAALPHAAWLAKAGSRARVVLRTNSMPAQGAAVEAGLGLGVLPCNHAERRPGLHRLVDAAEIPKLDLWLVLHRDLRRTPRVRALADYLREVIGRALP